MSERDPRALRIGIDFFCVPDITESWNYARQSFNFMVVPLVHPRYRRPPGANSAIDRTDPLTRTDTLLSGSQWNCIVGRLSKWIRLDSPSSRVRWESEKAFFEEMKWAAHLGVPSVLLPTPCYHCDNYARLLNNFLLPGGGCPGSGAWVHIPTSTPALDEHYASGMDGVPVPAEADPWEYWNALRTRCEHNPLLGVCLELSANLPPQEALDRWRGEPVKAVVVPTSVFQTNKKGYPVLSARHQQLLQQLYDYDVQVIIKGRPRHHEGVEPYMQYVQFLRNKMPKESEQVEFERPFFDYLQAPLQPLMDNLESATYEVFEKDPVKYAQYEEAVYHALVDRFAGSAKAKQQQGQESSAPVQQKPVLMVVGAGRGPLVKASLRASKRANIPITVYAVEKNPNAIITLRNLVREEWGDCVTVISSDMRTWQAPQKCDILVSELLGSFSDNELSPECLDGAQRFLKDSGISIPCKYTSYLAPMASNKLWNDVKAYSDLAHFETPYVVRLHNVRLLADAQPVFVFEHPSKDRVIDNNRYLSMKFKIGSANMMHGFAGYFDAQLYGDIYISTHPVSYSVGMFSWFPLYFPLRQPVYVEENGEVEVNMWRCVGPTKVWYEWGAVSGPSRSPIHNPAGRSYAIGL